MIFSSLAGISIRRSPFWLVSLVSISLPVVSRSFSYSGNRMSSSFTTERTIQDGTTTISLTPKQESLQSALVVIAHGLGDSADGLADVAEVFAQQLPYCKFILPTAPVQPVTLNGGMPMNSWYDIVGLDERSNESCHGIEDSRKKLMTILQNEHEQTGLPYRRMVLAGFSQGGALSLYTGLQMPNVEQKLAGVCVMSGYLPHAKQFQITQGLEDCPVWHGHGTQDMVVAYKMAERSKEAVTAKGCSSYTLKSYPIGHTIHNNEMKDVVDFLHNILPDDTAHRIQLKDPAEMSVKELKTAIRKAGLQHKAVGLMEKHEFVKLLQAHRSEEL